MMEEELKVSLFLRGTKRITLTEAGKTLYEQAEKILTLTELTKSEVLKSSQATTLHIGMTPSTVSMMSNYLQQFARRYPQIRFDIHEGSTFTLKEQMENQQVDITTLRTPIALSGCEVKSLAKERLLAMAIPEYPLFEGKTSVSLHELMDQPLILSRRYQKYMLSVFEKAGVTQNIYCACEDARTALIIAEKGLGIAILPASMLKQSEKLKAWEIKDADLATEILLVWRKGRVAVEVKKFLEMMEDAKEG